MTSSKSWHSYLAIASVFLDTRSAKIHEGGVDTEAQLIEKPELTLVGIVGCSSDVSRLDIGGLW